MARLSFHKACVLWCVTKPTIVLLVSTYLLRHVETSSEGNSVKDFQETNSDSHRVPDYQESCPQAVLYSQETSPATGCVQDSRKTSYEAYSVQGSQETDSEADCVPGFQKPCSQERAKNDHSVTGSQEISPEAYSIQDSEKESSEAHDVLSSQEINPEAYCVPGCQCSKSENNVTLKCYLYLPNFLPGDTSSVHVLDIYTTYLLPDHFSGDAWRKITELHLQSWRTQFIDEFIFTIFENLQHLQMSFDTMRTLPAGCFSPLQKLRVLDLSGNKHLTFDEVTKALSFSGSLPNLEEIYLEALQKYLDSATLDDTFFSAVASKPVRKLSLSGANVNTFSLQAFVPLGVKLEVLNVSDISFASMNFIDLFLRNIFVTLPSDFFSSLQVMDISYAKLPEYLLLSNAKHQVWMFDCASPLYRAEHMIANGISPFEIRHIKVTLLTRNCKRKLYNKIEVRHNNLVWMDAHVSEDLFSYREVDLSYNHIQYINPNLTAHFSQTIRVDISHNELHHMETFPEFNEFLSFNTLLEHIDLSFNGFTKLPKTFFQNTTRLMVIKLSGNNLHRIDFQMETLTSLKYLDISSNKIMHVDSVTRMNLQLLFSTQSVSSNNEIADGLSVNMDRNPFVCSCENRESLHWVLENKLYFNNTDRFTCMFEGNNEPFDFNTLALVESYCEQRIIMLTTIIGLGLLFTASCTIYWVLSKSRREKAEPSLVHRYQAGECEGKYLLFVSYSDCDENFFKKHVYEQLKTRLGKRLKEVDKLICHNEEFKGGHMLTNEYKQYITEDSIVILLMVSNEYCEDIFCLREATLAYEYNKPIIVMLTEQVDVYRMSPELLAIFSKCTKVKREFLNGEWVLMPDWDMLCNSIIELADDYLDRKNKVILPQVFDETD